MRKFAIGFIFLTVLNGALSAAAQVPLEKAPYWRSAATGVYSTGMIWRDADNDGYIDLFIANGNDMARAANVLYLSNYGVLPTTSSWASGDIKYSGHCAVGDIDDNGFPEFIVSNFIGDLGFDTPDRSIMYVNPDGYPHTMPDWYTTDSIYTFSCALGDIDGDGDLDLAFATGEGYYYVPQRDRIYVNEGGVFYPVPVWQSENETISLDVTFGDVDNDGDLDIAFCDDYNGALIYYNNNGVIESLPSWQSDDLQSANTLIFGDVDGDGWRDLIVAYNNQLGPGGYFRVYFNDGTGQLNTTAGWQSATGGYGSGVSMYDYDNDGDDDLAAGRWFDKPRIYENTGGTFTASPIWRADSSVVVEELAWVDVDGDGVEELADTFYISAGEKLFYAKHHPLYAIDSVLVDDVFLDYDQYCYDLVDAWLSLGRAPAESLVVYYRYSFKNDLALSNWDGANMVFGDTSRPYIDIYADTGFGWAPLAVQFSDSSVGASGQAWRFGDGATATEPHPLHTYETPGAFDVYMAADLANGRHNRTWKKMIVVLGDTVFFPEILFSTGDTIKIPVYLKNSQPLDYFVLPISYGGTLGLDYIGYDTDSCRSDYFEDVRLGGLNPFQGKVFFSFMPDVQAHNPPLAPGYGRLINIYFRHTSGEGVNILDTTTYNSQTLHHYAGYADYVPAVVSGTLTRRPYDKGDVNHDGRIDILDIIFIINYKYKEGPEPGMYEGDVNCDETINILDIIYLINYKYKDGPAPSC